LKNAVFQLTKYIRQAAVEVLYNLFILGTKECEGNKKLNSFTIFNNYFQELRARKSYGYSSTITCYKSLKKVMRIIDENYAEAHFE